MIRWLLACVVLVTSSSVARAADSVAGKPAAPAATGRIALVDVARVFKEYARFREQQDEMKGEVQRASLLLEGMKKKHLELTAARAAAETTEDRAAIDRDLLKSKQDYEALQETTKQSLTRNEATLYRETFTEVQATIAKHARANGYTLVLRFNSEELTDRDEPKQVLAKLNRNVLFTEPEHDLTDKIIAILNGATE